MLGRDREIYSLLDGVLERSINTESDIDKVKSGKCLFLVEELNSDKTNRELIMFTKDFVISVEMEIELGDTSAPIGKWHKYFYACNKTKEFYPEAEEVSDDDIIKWISDHTLDFI